MYYKILTWEVTILKTEIDPGIKMENFDSEPKI